MKLRTLFGVLLALVAVVLVGLLVQHNGDALGQRLTLGDSLSISLAAALVGVFLLGLLPPVTVLVVQRLQQELQARRERRLSREADSRQVSFRRALDYKADGQWGKAALEFQSLLGEKPEDFAALLHFGEVLRRQGRAPEALDVHRKASVLYPQSVALLYELAEDYASLGEEQVSREIRNRILRDFSGVGLGVQRHRRTRAIAAGAWHEADRLQESIDAILVENGADAELGRERLVRLGLTYQRGVRRLEEERFEEADEIFRDLLDREPRFIPAAIMAGESALLQGSAEAALADWIRSYEATGSPVFLQRIEDHFIESAQPERAIETLHQLIARADNDLLPRFYLGRLYFRLEMLDEAQRQLLSIGDRVGSSPTYHLLLARIYQRRGNLQRAVKSYITAIKQGGLADAEYGCASCGSSFGAWNDRCEVCGAWNSLDLGFEEERLSAAELGVLERPVWTAVDDSEDEDPPSAS